MLRHLLYLYDRFLTSRDQGGNRGVTPPTRCFVHRFSCAFTNFAASSDSRCNTKRSWWIFEAIQANLRQLLKGELFRNDRRVRVVQASTRMVCRDIWRRVGTKACAAIRA